MANEQYARLAAPKTFTEMMGRPIYATHSLATGIIQKESNDARLAQLDDAFKRAAA